MYLHFEEKKQICVVKKRWLVLKYPISSSGTTFRAGRVPAWALCPISRHRHVYAKKKKKKNRSLVNVLRYSDLDNAVGSTIDFSFQA